MKMNKSARDARQFNLALIELIEAHFELGPLHMDVKDGREWKVGWIRKRIEKAEQLLMTIAYPKWVRCEQVEITEEGEGRCYEILSDLNEITMFVPDDTEDGDLLSEMPTSLEAAHKLIRSWYEQVCEIETKMIDLQELITSDKWVIHEHEWEPREESEEGEE